MEAVNRAKQAGLTAAAVLAGAVGGLVAVYHGIKGMELDDWLGTEPRRPPAELRAALAEHVAEVTYATADRLQGWAWWCEVKAEQLRGEDPGD